MSFSYFIGILVSLLLHVAVIGLLFFQGVKKPQEIKVRPPVIHANLITETPTQKKTQQALKSQQTLKLEQQKKLQEKKRLEQKRLAEKKQAEKKIAERKAAEKARQIKIAKQKAEAKAKKEKLAKEKAAQQKAEKERLVKEKAEKLKREKALQAQALAEQQRLEAENELAALVAKEQQAIQLAEDQQQAADIVGVITAYAQGQWNRPPSARNNMQVILQVDMVPTGEVINVSVLESSGDAAFDRSAINAVNKAAPFDELKTIPSRVFENYFRRFKMIFRPEDLRR